MPESAQQGTGTFRKLTLGDWRQFGLVEIEFHPRLTVLTGANASGKSTILALLAKHFSWTRPYWTSPIGRDLDGATVWAARPFMRQRLRLDTERNVIGSLQYANGNTANLSIPNSHPGYRGAYEVSIDGMNSAIGLYLPSHRSISGNYAPVQNIPTDFKSPSQMFEMFAQEIRTRWGGGWSGKSPYLAFKEALMSCAVFGEGNSSVDPNPVAREVWTGYQSVLRELVPDSIGFRRLRVRTPDIVVETESGDFLIDDASGGLSAILELSWQIFLRSRDATAFTVIFDEPENHLHPSLQRELMPSLLRAFSNVQFIVASHSPFVVTSTPQSNVYALDYDDGRQIVSRELDYANKGANAEETLRRVLGLGTTYPIWAEDRFAQVVSQYVGGEMTFARMRQLRAELKESGLESEFTSLLATLADLGPRSSQS